METTQARSDQTGISRRAFVAGAAALAGAVAAGSAVRRALADAAGSEGGSSDGNGDAGTATASGAPDDAYAGLTPLEIQLIERAQEIYDEKIRDYGSAEAYASHILDLRLNEYEKTLREAELYNQAYDDICNYSLAFVDVAVGVLKQDPGDVITPYLNMTMDMTIEQSFLGEVAKNFSGLDARSFIFGQAKLGAKMVQSATLQEAMEAAEKNDGRFANAADAARFLLIYQQNEAGFAALRMGRNYYRDQLNKGALETALDLAKGYLTNLVISAGLDAVLPGDWTSAYLSGKAVDALTSSLDAIVEEINDPNVTQWRDDLVRIEQQTREMFTAPLVYTVSRINGIMGTPSWWGTSEVATPEQIEALGLYRDFDATLGLSPAAAAAFMDIVDGLTNTYGTERLVYVDEAQAWRKAGVTGGWLCDLNGDGTAEMLVVACGPDVLRYSEGGYLSAVHYEYWSWQNGEAVECLSGDLEDDEYLNVWEGADGQYLEMGNSATGEHWFMATDPAGRFGRASEAPDEAGLVRRIPVAAGGGALLANSRALVGHLGEVAGGLALADPASVLDHVAYLGDPAACSMGANRAAAFADSIACDYHGDVDSPRTLFQQVALIDAGEDGYPVLLKTLPNAWTMIDRETSAHFIADAMLCTYEGGVVKEYPFVEEVGVVGRPGMFWLSWIDREQRRDGSPVLKAEVMGTYLGGDQGCVVDAYYFCDQGKFEPFHTLTTVGAEWLWDGSHCADADAALRGAALDYTDSHLLFGRDFADQYAPAYTSADVMEAMLRAYAASGIADEKIAGAPLNVETGVIYYGRDDKRVSARLGETLADLIRYKSTTTYQPRLAYALVALAAAAYNETYVRDSLYNLGMTTVDQYNYHDDPFDDARDSVGFSIAKGQTRDGRTLVCVPIRGTHGPIDQWTPEWQGDFYLGEAALINAWHPSFSAAAHDVFSALKHEKGSIDPDAVYVICGHSRGAAVGNLLAVLLQREGVPQQQVFCYNFACPDSARGAITDWNPSNVHGNIWNIGRPSDPVSLLPGVVCDLLQKGVIASVAGAPWAVASTPLSAWGKFGRSYWYAPDWLDIGAIVPDLTFAPHETSGYIDLLANEPGIEDMREWAEMIALMPADSLVSAVTQLAELITDHIT